MIVIECVCVCVCVCVCAQCLVIGEITCEHMIVVLNKIDLIDEAKREGQVAKVSNTLLQSYLHLMADFATADDKEDAQDS